MPKIGQTWSKFLKNWLIDQNHTKLVNWSKLHKIEQLIKILQNWWIDQNYTKLIKFDQNLIKSYTKLIKIDIKLIKIVIKLIKIDQQLTKSDQTGPNMINFLNRCQSNIPLVKHPLAYNPRAWNSNLSLLGAWVSWSDFSASLGLADLSIGELVEGSLTTHEKDGTASESGDIGDRFPLRKNKTENDGEFEFHYFKA